MGIKLIRTKTHSKTTRTGDLVLYPLVDGRTQVAQHSAFLGQQQTTGCSTLEGMRPERGGVHDWGLGRGHQWGNVPNEGALDTQQLLGLDQVSLVQQDARLVLASLQLVQNGLGLWSHVQLGWVVDQEDNVRSVDEPLASIVEGEHTGHLFAHLQDSGNLHNVHLCRGGHRVMMSQ